MSSPPPSSASAAPAADPPPSQPPPRKFPAPCWTQEETLALITIYKEKWYSLRRSNLRTSDWESVAADVISRCPDQFPPKTSAQCRHKMEKLRKRYRTEKQRFLSLPHNPNPNANSRFFSPSSWVFFDLMDSMDGGSNTQFPTNPPSGIPLKAVINHNRNPDLVEKPPNLKEDKDKFDKYFDEILMGIGGGDGGGGAASVKLRVNNNHHHHNPNRFHGLDDAEGYYDDNGGGGGGRNLMRGPPPGCKRKFSGQDYDARFDDFDSRKMGSRRRDLVAEMVASIKMLGEGMIKMETMKMEMMREIEKMRMEMEMKRSEMVIESQHIFVNAIVEGLKNNNKVKVMEVEE